MGADIFKYTVILPLKKRLVNHNTSVAASSKESAKLEDNIG